MAKRKNLNGLPHNFTQSFFGTERYYGRGYMADWLLNAARTLNLENASLAVLTAQFTPNELSISPLIFHAKSLKKIIAKELLAQGFPIDFISEAKIDFKFPNHKLYRSTIYCFPFMIDKDGRRYESKRIIAEAFEPTFNPFDHQSIYPEKKKTIFDKIRGFFNQ